MDVSLQEQALLREQVHGLTTLLQASRQAHSKSVIHAEEEQRRILEATQVGLIPQLRESQFT